MKWLMIGFLGINCHESLKLLRNIILTSSDARVIHGVCVLGTAAGDCHHLLQPVLNNVSSVLGGETLLEQPRARILQFSVLCVTVVHEQVQASAVAQGVTQRVPVNTGYNCELGLQ